MTESLQIIGSRSDGGAEGFYCRLTNALSAQQKTWAMLPPDSALNNQLCPKVNKVGLRMRAVWDLWARLAIARWIARERPAVAQTWMGRATRLTHLPRNSPTVHLARLGGFYDVRGYRHADGWIGNTVGICDHLIRHGLPADKVFYIGNFVEPVAPVDAAQKRLVRDTLGIDAEALVVLTTGRLHPNKGFADLLHAIAQLPAELGGRKLLFLLVGDGPLRASLHALANSLGVSDRVCWTGWQTDTTPYYQAADAFVCPSRHEPLGNVVLEAWSYQLPLVATRSQGPSELMADGEDGCLVPVNEPVALAGGIQQMLSRPSDELEELAGNGRAKVHRLYSREAIVAQYLALYARLTENR